MLTKNSENYPFRNLKQMRDETSKANTTRPDVHGSDNLGNRKDDSLRRLENLACMIVTTLLFIGCIWFLAWFFEGKDEHPKATESYNISR